MDSNLINELTHYCNVSIPKLKFMPKEYIDFFDFTYILDGYMEYECDGEYIKVGKNDAIFLRPGTARTRFSGTFSKFVSFNFTSDYDSVFPFPKLVKGCVNETLRKLPKLFPHTHLYREHFAMEKCKNMLNYLLFEMLDNATLVSSNIHVEKIIKYIDFNITKKITLDDIAKQVNLSREYTCSIFKKETGKTITDYINGKKMNTAKEFVIAREMSLGDISSYLGYDDYNYFSRLFKKTFGTSPIGLRNG